MHQVTLQPSGRAFSVAAGQTILEAGLNAGFALPYSCRAAVCSSCRARVVGGEVDLGVVFGTLSERDKANGYALLCRAKPLSDVCVEVSELQGLDGIKPRTLPCRVVSIEKPSADVAILRVRVPNSDGIRFLAGQYVDFLLPDGTRRSFSIATKPSREHATELEFHVRRVGGGAFTARVFDTLAPREILRMEAPLGGFFVREDSDKPIILLASGTGFAPIKAMCEAGLASGLFDRRPASLYWGGRTRAHLYMLEHALGWSHPRLRVVPVLSEPTRDCHWHGATGPVHHAVLAGNPDLSGYQVYACGVPIMVESARADFIAAGLPPEEFFADLFLTQADRMPAVVDERQSKGEAAWG